MKTIFKYGFLIFTVTAFLSCEFDQKKEAELPDVNVEVEEGQLPSYDVDWADVNVGMRKDTVKIPKVVVVMEETTVEVPYIDVDLPNDSDVEKEEYNIMVQAEIAENNHELEIEEVRVSGNTLYVISELESTDEPIGEQKIRVSDQIHLNAPKDLNIKHLIIGERPERVFNKQYKYYSNKEEVDAVVADYQVVYSD